MQDQAKIKQFLRSWERERKTKRIPITETERQEEKKRNINILQKEKRKIYIPFGIFHYKKPPHQKKKVLFLLLLKNKRVESREKSRAKERPRKAETQMVFKKAIKGKTLKVYSK